MTINQAIKEAMKQRGTALSAREAYEAIIELGLYDFHAENPVHIVAGQIRRHCKGLDFPTASETKHFEIREDGKYWFLPEPTKQIVRSPPKVSRLRSMLRQLKVIQQGYDAELQAAILGNLKRLSPRDFEHFAEQLLTAYGFVDMKVTQFSKDGGIDGHGRLKVGLAFMKVAFQCKRFNQLTVGRPRIDEFRGAIQGEFEQGIFFTTSTFANGAKEASFRRGAVPVVLIDGKEIVKLMIEKQFGVQVERIPIYSYALDLVLNADPTNIVQTE